MAVQYDFTGIDRLAWRSLFFGLTQEAIDAFNKNYPDNDKPINTFEWLGSHTSPWFKPEPGKDDLHDYLCEQRFVMAVRYPFVHQVMMSLIPCMPSPGWGLGDKNIDEAVKRILIYQEVVGPLGETFVGPWPSPREKQRMFWQDRYITEEDIRKLNGLSVNFSTVNTSEFRKMIVRHLEENALNRTRRAIAAKKEVQPV